MKKKLHKPILRKLINERNYADAKKALEKWLSPELAPEIAHFISTLPDDEKGFVFTVLPDAMVISTFKVLDIATQKAVIKNLPHEQSAKILNAIQPDDRTEFLSELPSPVVKELLKLLSDEERTVTLKQLGYPEHSVGRLMTPEYVAVKTDWTVQHVLDYVRKNGKDKETINVIYVINDEGVLIDDPRIREFLFVDTDKKVSDIVDNKFISLHAYDGEETAISLFRNNNRVALPVTDEKGILLGIVTIDDVLRLAEKEVTEDIQKIGGMDVLDEPYMNIPFFKLM